MSNSLYITSLDAQSGKAIAALAFMEHLFGRVENVNVFRPVVSGNIESDALITLMMDVDDTFQGLGIASSILRHLVAIARESGIAQFEAAVLPSNEAMLRVFALSGLPVVRAATSESIHLSIELTREEEISATGDSERLNSHGGEQ